eukprot:GEMP01022203.1.p1 GENE.GEMP01022203.1~~GEMP01022203.1.p1  ORF type:complete len:482 (+),score=51.84 GEMP01022203.1:52-1497(+)
MCPITYFLCVILFGSTVVVLQGCGCNYGGTEETDTWVVLQGCGCSYGGTEETACHTVRSQTQCEDFSSCKWRVPMSGRRLPQDDDNISQCTKIDHRSKADNTVQMLVTDQRFQRYREHFEIPRTGLDEDSIPQDRYIWTYTATNTRPQYFDAYKKYQKGNTNKHWVTYTYTPQNAMNQLLEETRFYVSFIPAGETAPIHSEALMLADFRLGRKENNLPFLTDGSTLQKVEMGGGASSCRMCHDGSVQLFFESLAFHVDHSFDATIDFDTLYIQGLRGSFFRLALTGEHLGSLLASDEGKNKLLNYIDEKSLRITTVPGFEVYKNMIDNLAKPETINFVRQQPPTLPRIVPSPVRRGTTIGHFYLLREIASKNIDDVEPQTEPLTQLNAAFGDRATLAHITNRIPPGTQWKNLDISLKKDLWAWSLMAVASLDPNFFSDSVQKDIVRMSVQQNIEDAITAGALLRERAPDSGFDENIDTMPI